MPIGYDPLLGELRSSNAKLIVSQPVHFPGKPFLHLPLHDDAKDISPYQHEIPDNYMVFTKDGWASGELQCPLPDTDLSEMTLCANVKISGRGDMFGIDSDDRGFFWENRGGSYTVLETWNGSYDHEFPQGETGEAFHLTATLSGNIITVYVNGILWEQKNWSSLDFPGAVFYIWDGWGLISDVRLYNTCLTDAEVWDVYQTDRR